MKLWNRIALVLFCLSFFYLFKSIYQAEAASIFVSPSAGTFTIGGTVNVSLYLDTAGESVNAFDIILNFPSDKLQVISPGTGSSVVGVWASQPKYDNLKGVIELQGGIPGGITTSNGLIASFLFRIKSLGSAIIKPSNDSKVLKNDGLATDVLDSIQGAIFDLKLPPPLGPLVVSETHPDESIWYQNQDLVLTWATDEKVSGYSYVLNQDPIFLPDNISEGVRNSISYNNLASGRYYFHIKALRDGSWGGVTHHGVKIDYDPPAPFPIEVIPNNKTIQKQPIIQFATTDSLSGIDRYEVKIVRRSGGEESHNPEERVFFIEAQSPYIPELLDFGNYDVLVRAYDKANNFLELSERVEINPAVLRVLGSRGLEFRQRVTLSWPLALGILFSLILGMGFIGWRVHHWHHMLNEQHVNKELPKKVRDQLDELKHYRDKYKNIALLLFLVFGISFFFGGGRAFAEERTSFPPPLITSISKNLSNNEIFYIGGKTTVSEADIIIYIQNTETGDVTTDRVQADFKGDWFYRQNRFLPAGEYISWVQGQNDSEMSPPSSQEIITVGRAALQFGASRLSYRAIYGVIIFLLILGVIGMGAYIISHGIRGKRKQKAFLAELKRTEEGLERGFALLERDIKAELMLIKKAREGRELSEEETLRETQLLQDIDAVKKYIKKETWEIEEAERHLQNIV